MSQPIRVALIDIPPIVGAGLRATLAIEPDICVAGDVASAGDWREGVRSTTNVFLLDPRGPGPRLVTLLASLRAGYPDARVLLVAERAEANWASDLLDLGVAGCLLTAAPPTTVAPAIRLVCQGGLWPGPALRVRAGSGRGEPGQVSLTAREREVLALLALGQGNAAIAAALSISSRTVDYHIRNLLAKLGGHSRIEALHQARRLGLLTPTTAVSDPAARPG